MFRTNTIKSFSTRNRKQNKEVPTSKKVINQNKKKVPIIKEINTSQISLTKQDGIISLAFDPQERIDFLDGNHTDGADAITLDISSNPNFNEIIKGYESNNLLYVYLNILTLKQTGNSIDCNFLPFKIGTSGDRVNKVTFIYKPNEDSDSTETKTINIDNFTVSILQVINMSSEATLITPVESSKAQFESVDLDQTIPKLTITGNYEESYLTNFRIEGDQHQHKDYTHLVVKGNTKYWMGLPKRNHPSTSNETNDYWTVSSINEIVDTGIQNEEGTGTKKIGINNELTLNATTNANDSFIDFRGIELTDTQKTEAYWNNFYVNEISRYSNQEFSFNFQGYRGTELFDATEVITTIAPATNASIDNNVLTLTFDNEEPGFLGETEEINVGTVENPNIVEAIAIYLDATKSSQIRDNINNVNTIKLIVSHMRVITQTTGPNIDCFVKRVVEGTAVEPTYVVVYYLNASNDYTGYNKQITETSFLQEITNLNVIYGEVIEEGENENKKKLFTPATITGVWNENKLNLKTVTPTGLSVTIGEVQTTNCLIANAKLNIVVQGEIPFEWYDSWLPLNNVYIQTDKSVVIDPEANNGLTQIYSINNLPDTTEGDLIGIKTVKPTNFDEPASTDVYSWIDLTHLIDFTGVNSRIKNSNGKMTFFVNMIKIRKELNGYEIPFYQWNGTTEIRSWKLSIEMEYTDLIKGFDIETNEETTTKSLVIIFEDQITSKFLEPEEGETFISLDISNNEELSKELCQKIEELGNENVGPEILCLNKLRLINRTNDTLFFTNFYTSTLKTIEIIYLKYNKIEENQWIPSGVVDYYSINTVDSENKIINRVNNLIVIQGTITDTNGTKLLEPINALQTGSGDSFVKGIFEEENKKVHLELAYINVNANYSNSIYNNNVIPS